MHSTATVIDPHNHYESTVLVDLFVLAGIMILFLPSNSIAKYAHYELAGREMTRSGDQDGFADEEEAYDVEDEEDFTRDGEYQDGDGEEEDAMLGQGAANFAKMDALESGSILLGQNATGTLGVNVRVADLSEMTVDNVIGELQDEVMEAARAVGEIMEGTAGQTRATEREKGSVKKD